MYACQECGRKFRTERAAFRAGIHGCPKCGGVDIDLDVSSPRTAVSLTAQLAAMKPGEAQHVNGHRVERVASGWIIDEVFASSPRQIAACLLQSEPCQRQPAAVADDEFDSP